MKKTILGLFIGFLWISALFFLFLKESDVSSLFSMTGSGIVLYLLWRDTDNE